MIRQTLRTLYLSLEYTNTKNDNRRWYVWHHGQSIFLWKRYTYENDDHRWYVKHYGPCIYISNTQTKNDNHRSYVEHYGHGMYVWKKQILTSIIIDDASKTIKGFLYFTHASYFHVQPSVLAIFLFLSHFISLLLFLCTSVGDNIRTWVAHSYSHTECYLLLSWNETVLA